MNVADLGNVHFGPGDLIYQEPKFLYLVLSIEIAHRNKYRYHLKLLSLCGGNTYTWFIDQEGIDYLKVYSRAEL